MMIDVGIVVPSKDSNAVDIDAGTGTEVGQRDVSRAIGVGRQEVGRLPDAAAGASHVDGVARGVGGVDGDRADLAGVARDRRRADRRPLFARERIGLAQCKNTETGIGVIAAGLAQARGRQRLLETQ